MVAFQAQSATDLGNLLRMLSTDTTVPLLMHVYSASTSALNIMECHEANLIKCWMLLEEKIKNRIFKIKTKLR